jgi:hypothetical protein
MKGTLYGGVRTIRSFMKKPAAAGG